MATVNQIYELINAVQADALGSTAITVKDTGTLVSLGETVLSSSTNTDKFYQKLVDRIGSTYIKYRSYVATNRGSIVKKPMDFGIILQKVQTFKIAGAKENTSWTNQADPFEKEKDTTDLVQSLFSKLGTWEVDTKIIYDYQLRTAFTSATEMGAFVNLIFNDMYNALEFQIEQTIKLTKATMIAQAFKGNNANIRRNLLKEYNTNHTLTLTEAEALETPGFLKYASREIMKVVKRLPRMTELFNSAGADRFTSKEDMVVDILTDYSSAAATYLEADTFNKELVALPNYNDIDSWQGSGTSYAFNDVSSINIKDEAGITKAQSGIIAVIYDKDACGMMIDRVRTKSIYNPASELTNYFHKADYGYFVDSSENCVVFYMDADEEVVQMDVEE